MEAPQQQTLLFPDELAQGEYPIPADEAPASCRSCGAAIVWTRTDANKAIPLALATARECNGRRVATTHFADCPQGRAWRRS